MLQIRVESVLSMYCILENLSSDPVGTGGCAYDPVGTDGCAYDPAGTGGCAYDHVGTGGCSYDPVGTGGCAYDLVGTDGCAYDPVGTGSCARSCCIGLSGLILYKNGRKDYEMDDRVGHSRFGILL